MFTNLVLKKFALGMMMLAMFSMMLMTIGCSDNSENPVAVDDADAVIQLDEGQYEISEAEIEEFTVQADLYQKLINEMGPYVTENKDGTYSFDSVGFLAARQDLDVDDIKVYTELSKGIPIVNDQIIQERKNPGSTALGAACWYYWWGKRCCYWGSTAWQIVSIAGAGGFIPGIGWVSGLIGIYLAYYTQVYGGFCLNRSWVGGQWVTRP